MKSQATADDVADYLVWLVAHERSEDRDFLTPLRLQKLLYFVQGWALAEWDAPMFTERIEAWKNGPVVPEVWRRFKDLGDRPIMEERENPPPLTDAAKALIHSVWDAYKKLSAYGLSDLTHKVEEPYIEAYKPDMDGRCNRQISREHMARWFHERANRSFAQHPAKRERLRELARRNTIRLTGRDAI